MISSIVIVNAKGEILIYRVYKDDITYNLYFFLIFRLNFLVFFKFIFKKFLSKSSRNSTILHKNRRNKGKQRISNREH